MINIGNAARWAAAALLFFALGMRVSAAVSGLSDTAGVPEARSVPVPVLMYHSLVENGTDEWTISPGEFAADMKYLRVTGYQGVGASDLVAFVDEGAPLPEKPVLITFDDGYYNTLLHALPLMEEYEMKLVLSVIGDYADQWTEAGEINERDGHASWPQLAEAAKSGRVELSNHTQSLHTHKNGRSGCVRMPGENLDSYRAMLMRDVGKLQDSFDEYCGAAPICFAYPFGSKCPDSLNVLKSMGFRVTLSCYEGLTTVTEGDKDSLYDMHRCNRTPRKTAEMILTELGLVK